MAVFQILQTKRPIFMAHYAETCDAESPPAR
jgi:hypothetical protein